MKIIFLAAVALLFIGFGCTPAEQIKNVSSSPTDTAATGGSVVETIPPTPLAEEKAWRLSFDLPAGWVMAAYGSPRTQNQTAPNLEIEKDADNIYLQNTTKFPLFGGRQPDDYSAEKYQDKNVVQIKVSTLDKAEIVPPIDSVKNEDLGNGFYKVTTCDIVTTPECEIYGQSSFEYYFVAVSGNKYRFSFTSQDVPESVIQAVVLSAKE
ncbi:MAG: hypothetical protein V1716_01190 [Candidatus Uhrbacteria bacterium]